MALAPPVPCDGPRRAPSWAARRKWVASQGGEPKPTHSDRPGPRSTLAAPHLSHQPLSLPSRRPLQPTTFTAVSPNTGRLCGSIESQRVSSQPLGNLCHPSPRSAPPPKDRPTETSHSNWDTSRTRPFPRLRPGVL